MRLVTRPDPVSETSREIDIRVTGPERFAFDYRVVNRAERPQRLAAWAITMMRPAGPGLAAGAHRSSTRAASRASATSCSGRTHATMTRARGRTTTPSRSLGGAGPGPWTRLQGRHITAAWLGRALARGRAAGEVRRPRRVPRVRRHGCVGPDLLAARLHRARDPGPADRPRSGDAAEHHEDWAVHLVDEAEAERLVLSGELDR